MNKAIFTDKDGTLIKNVPYNVDPSLIELQPFAGKALKRLQKKGFKIIVISNQSGVARGLFRENKLQDVGQEISRLLNKYKVKMEGFYYCPHLPESGGSVKQYCFDCSCRKPKPGLLFKAATANSINLSESWMIGDILNDIEAGSRAGCKTMLFDSGGETEWELNKQRIPDRVIRSWNEIPKIILEEKADSASKSVSHRVSALDVQ